jgi:LacI family transcriptional regulator
VKRPTIVDLARAAGVSVSTVDRVLNGRDPVTRAKAEKVLAAAQGIGFHAAGAIRRRLVEDRPERVLGFVLQQGKGAFYRMVAEALKIETERAPSIRGRFKVDFLEDLSPASVAEHIASLAKVADAVAMVAADHPRVSQVIEQASGRGVPIFALITDLTAQARAGYVGCDNWKLGRTAGWAISNMCQGEAKVGIAVGSHRYLCQDVSEMSFRSYLREHSPQFNLLEPLTTLEDVSFAYENALELLKRHPDLTALFVAGGGIEGVMQAIADTGPADRVVVVGRDLTEDNRTALIEGNLKLVLSHPIQAMAAAVVDAMVVALGDAPPAFQQVLLPFDLWTAENV